MTGAELRALLTDCLAVWEVRGTVTVTETGAAVIVGDRRVTLHRADHGDRPIRWLMQTPDRSAAGRPPRPLPSIVATLTALRAAIG
ncbi:MAG: hypothetical protein ACREF3_14325 [Acetobacteraceae bacterium]